MSIQNNLKICDSSCIFRPCGSSGNINLWLGSMAWDFWGVLFEALEIFWGFDFSPHLIIPVTWNPEYHPLGLNRYQGLLTKIDQLSLSFGNIL